MLRTAGVTIMIAGNAAKKPTTQAPNQAEIRLGTMPMLIVVTTNDIRPDIKSAMRK